MAFGYLKDPLFLLCFTAYWVNRCLEARDLSPSVLRSYLNDLICIPFWIPIILWISRRLRLRQHDGPPQGSEVVIPMLIWAVVFELVLPATRGWSHLAHADPYDVLCYALGACLAVLVWKWRYGSSSEPAM